MKTAFLRASALSVLCAVAACAPAPKPMPTPVTQVVVVPVIPSIPYPPAGAAATLVIPPLGFDGVRATPNRNLSKENIIWHLRSALNVAALSCQGPVWGQIATNYNLMLKNHKSRFTQTDKAVDAEFKKEYPGQNALRVRDTKLTELYNYFALPPVKQQYCDTALAKTTEIVAIPSTALPEYSTGALIDIDGIFIRFFDAYAQYERDLADWNQKYGAPSSLVSTVTNANP